MYWCEQVWDGVREKQECIQCRRRQECEGQEFMSVSVQCGMGL